MQQKQNPVVAYRRLNADQLAQSLSQLDVRIRERFPAAGLARVCQELIVITRENATRAAAIGRRDGWLWTGIVAVIAGAVFALSKVLTFVDFTKTNADNVYTVIQGVNSVIHILFVVAGAIFFLVTIEDRLKRQRALKALAELRSIIHVIDMHQLTKEPSAVLAGGGPTAHSPKRTLTAFQLGRYLDYCYEMLSLVAKVAVLYAQNLPDPVIVDAVSDIERLTANLSQQIWQKITLIHAEPAAFDARDPASRADMSAPNSESL